MRKIVFLIAIVSLAACHKIKSIVDIPFDIPYSQTVTLPAVPGYTYGISIPGGGVELPFPPVTMATNAQNIFHQYHASPAKVVSAYLGNTNLQITSGDQNFDYLDTIQIYISTETRPEVLVAYDYNIPKGQRSIYLLAVPGLNLKDYIVNDSITVRLNAHINAVPAPGTQVLSSGNFHVTANPLD